jgi:hypothetical protein
MGQRFDWSVVECMFVRTKFYGVEHTNIKEYSNIVQTTYFIYYRIFTSTYIQIKSRVNPLRSGTPFNNPHVLWLSSWTSSTSQDLSDRGRNSRFGFVFVWKKLCINFIESIYPDLCYIPVLKP